jgi:MerR family transcriptional regulator/heat shock protein HspR
MLGLKFAFLKCTLQLLDGILMNDNNRIEQQIWYKIGEVARKMDISVEMIRVYEREGILISEKTESGQRIYDDRDLHWIGCIRRLIQEQGLNIEGIRQLLALMPCWMWRPCTEDMQQHCVAFNFSSRPCWTIKDQIPEGCRAENCRTCNVYRSAIQCENLKPKLFEMMQSCQSGG